MTDTQPAGKVDPFNFPPMQRSDLMSLSTINQQKDSMKTNTKKFSTMRTFSNNMGTSDISGAVPKLHGSRPVQATKEQYNLANHDIERSAPR
mmetsp:Transcript_9374/g.14267  ORF Transcript_9374/g.14267 Transcript_9374/m.14267 type:complete len:92 (+) Transcript_9374:31-306(+)